MEFVIITGMSGAGKSKAVATLEDIDYFCIDNVPASFIPIIYELCLEEQVDKVALVTDVRSGDMFTKLNDTLDILKAHDYDYTLLFFECSDEIMVNRYKETRRKHPLQSEGYELQEAIESEKELLEPIRGRADIIIDTSLTSPAQLKERIVSLFLDSPTKGIRITSMSFGFKYGAPREADIVFDVRCFPNPFYIPELKNKTGLDSEVFNYVMDKEDAKTFEKKVYDMLDFLIPLYINEGKSSLVVAFGCTGGKHRSVSFAESTFNYLSSKNYDVKKLHRDITRNSVN